MSALQDKLASYRAFVEAKAVTTEVSGFDVPADALSPILFPHQRDIVRWALRGGRRACFASFGLGKTLMQLELCRLIQAREQGLTLIVCPLGVKQEFQRDAALLDMPAPLYIRTTDEALAAIERGQVHFITNYERIRDGQIAVSMFKCVCLDEASVLRGYGTKTYQTFLPLFEAIPYRFVFTATPSPNRYKELIHYAGFLGVMDTGQALTRFFQRNSEKAGDLTVYPHKEREFWLWVSSWAIFLQKPSDLGYSDAGYDLPELRVFYHPVKVQHSEARPDSWGQHKMFRDAAVSLQDAAREKRDSLPERLAKAQELIEEAGPDAHWLLWHHLERERDAIERHIPAARTVYGTQDIDERESLIIDFSDGDYPILATKPEIAGSGCNFQRHCHRNIFLGIDYQFNDFIQAIHRTHRFLQTSPVEVHIIYAESEENILKALQRKWQQHEELTARMSEIIREFGLTDNAMAEMRRSIGCERREVKGDYHTIVHTDCVEETMRMDTDSVDMILTSIPFSNHYEYSPSYNDFGHTDDDAHFFAQMDFLVPELLRVLRPGRIAAIHVKDRIMFGNVTGYGFPSVNPFSHKTTAIFQRHGFVFCGQITITTDVVRENNQTYRLGWSECCKDGSKMGVGSPEYLLLFRKIPTDTTKAYADVPVTKSKETFTRREWQILAHAAWRSSGDRLLSPDDLADMEMDRIQAWWKHFKETTVYDHATHVDLGRGLEQKGRLPASFMLFDPAVNTEWQWSDVTRMRTLNNEQSRRREENHICPLQFDIVDRAIHRYTNPGELVYDPFGGLMTVPYRAIALGRRGYGCELNPEYFECGRRYCYEAEYKRSAPTLFDLSEFEAAEASATELSTAEN